MSTSDLTQPRRRMGLLAAGALAGVLVTAIAGPAMVAQAADDSDAPRNIISVTGTGTVHIKPDVADLSVGVQVQRDRAGDASVDAANQMDAVIKALKAQGIADEDIQTTTLSLDPVYDYDSSPATLTGYSATNIVSVTIRDLATVGAVIDAAVDAGANNVGGLMFRKDDTSAAATQARAEAMAQARTVADELAKAAGVTITGVVSITETGSPTPQPIYYADAMGGAAMREAATPIQAGNVDVVVTVAVTYSISG